MEQQKSGAFLHSITILDDGTQMVKMNNIFKTTEDAIKAGKKLVREGWCDDYEIETILYKYELKTFRTNHYGRFPKIPTERMV